MFVRPEVHGPRRHISPHRGPEALVDASAADLRRDRTVGDVSLRVYLSNALEVLDWSRDDEANPTKKVRSDFLVMMSLLKYLPASYSSSSTSLYAVREVHLFEVGHSVVGQSENATQWVRHTCEITYSELSGFLPMRGAIYPLKKAPIPSALKSSPVSLSELLQSGSTCFLT